MISSVDFNPNYANINSVNKRNSTQKLAFGTYTGLSNDVAEILYKLPQKDQVKEVLQSITKEGQVSRFKNILFALCKKEAEPSFNMSTRTYTDSVRVNRDYYDEIPYLSINTNYNPIKGETGYSNIRFSEFVKDPVSSIKKLYAEAKQDSTNRTLSLLSSQQKEKAKIENTHNAQNFFA